jgi:hypothetical protein
VLTIQPRMMRAARAPEASLQPPEGTVKSHINHLLAKIDARDRAQAVTFAYQHGFTPPG